MFLMGLCSCSQIEWTELPPPPKAINIDEYKRTLAKSRQVSYQLEIDFPDNSTIKYYDDQLGPGWIKCDGRQKGWQSFGDVSGEKPYNIHQNLQYWANFVEGRILCLSLRYYSELRKCRKSPDTNQQHVVILEIVPNDIKEDLEFLNLTCRQ